MSFAGTPAFGNAKRKRSIVFVAPPDRPVSSRGDILDPRLAQQAFRSLFGVKVKGAILAPRSR
jgi:hypothetical protein